MRRPWARTWPSLLVAAGILLVACDRAPHVERSHFYAMGTRIEVSLPTGTPNADALRQRIRDHFQTFDHRWAAWGNGPLGQLNRQLSESASAPTPGELHAGLDHALLLARASGGRFHPAMGELVEAWGFHQQPRPTGPPPTSEQLTSLVANLPSIDAIKLTRDSITLPRTGARLDLGGIAKGLSLDQLRQRLDDNRLNGLLVSAGGDVLALGEAPGPSGPRPWQVGILAPRGNGVLGGVRLANGECIMTSGDYERRFRHDGKGYHHVLDPRTGLPARRVASVTVIARNCARADAAATALFVASEEQWPSVASAMAVEDVMRVTPEGSVTLTPTMADRLQFSRDPDRITIRSLP